MVSVAVNDIANVDIIIVGNIYVVVCVFFVVDDDCLLIFISDKMVGQWFCIKFLIYFILDQILNDLCL